MTTATTITTAQQFADQLTDANNRMAKNDPGSRTARNDTRERAVTQSVRHHASVGAGNCHFQELVYDDYSTLVLAYDNYGLRDWKVGPRAPKDILAHAAGYATNQA